MIDNINLIIGLYGSDNLLKLRDKLYTYSYYPTDTLVASKFLAPLSGTNIVNIVIPLLRSID